MEERKEIEKRHYNKKILQRQDNTLFVLQSGIFLKKATEEKTKNKKVLDYGCGNGAYSKWLSETANEVIGIDISEESLKAAKTIAPKAEFFNMDCEKMIFEDNSFDVVFDSGSFCSLDHQKAFSEIARVLKPGGVLIGIETLGHNPLVNLKRRANLKEGRGTEWSVNHIFKMQDLEFAKSYFADLQVHYFHLISWGAIPFLKFPAGTYLLKFLERVDRFLLFFFPFLERYCFKVVFIFSGVKNKGSR